MNNVGCDVVLCTFNYSRYG